LILQILFDYVIDGVSPRKHLCDLLCKTSVLDAQVFCS
jgi:hypothetical protein